MEKFGKKNPPQKQDINMFSFGLKLKIYNLGIDFIFQSQLEMASGWELQVLILPEWLHFSAQFSPAVPFSPISYSYTCAMMVTS